MHGVLYCVCYVYVSSVYMCGVKCVGFVCVCCVWCIFQICTHVQVFSCVCVCVCMHACVNVCVCVFVCLIIFIDDLVRS